MDVAFVSALAALAGSGVGGLTAGVTTWVTQRVQTHAQQIGREMLRREELYREFIIDASRVYADALTTSEAPIHEIVRLYAMISRMRVLSSPRVVEIADKIMLTCLDTFSAPNKSMPELRELMTNGPGIDPLREFSQAAREELQLIMRQ